MFGHAVGDLRDRGGARGFAVAQDRGSSRAKRFVNEDGRFYCTRVEGSDDGASHQIPDQFRFCISRRMPEFLPGSIEGVDHDFKRFRFIYAGCEM